MITSGSLVSVVMANYNTPEQYLRSAIESILSQTYQNFEFIIVDDASTKNDVDIIKSYKDERIILLQNESNHHVSYTVNRGLALARGEYIARMDSDDICLPQRLEKQVAFMQRRRDLDILCAQAKLIGAKNGVFALGVRRPDKINVLLFFGCPIVNPTVMLRASYIQKHGLLYDASVEYKAAEDYELWSRCLSTARICEYPQVLLKYRVHAKQISTLTAKMQIESANRIRRRMLGWLGIVPSPHETSVHYLFCTDTISPDIMLNESESWARRLLDGNKQYQVFDPHYFKQEVLQHFFVAAVKKLTQRQITLRQVFKLRMMRQALSPINIPGYFKRYLFSSRLNRFIK
jgi:glycosyltransferase involved in cell wall biosynthesis